MERLTKRNENGSISIKFDCQEGCEYLTCSMEEGYQCKHQCEGDIICKLADYEDAEEQGSLIKLPCKVGDTVFLIMKRLSEKTGTVEKLIIDAQIYKIEIFDKEILFKNNKTYSFQPKDVGKKVFLTKEEAEQALEAMKGD